MSAKIVELGPHDRMKPAEAIALATREKWKTLIVAGYVSDAGFVVFSSSMKPETALWIAEQLRMWALDVEPQDTDDAEIS